MATYYVDYVSGLDTNNGTTWALAKKTIQGATAVAVGETDTILVAKSSDLLDLGPIQTTGGSSTFDLMTPQVVTMFDGHGDFSEAAVVSASTTRNTTLPGGAGSDWSSSTGIITMKTRLGSGITADVPHLMGVFHPERTASPNPVFPTIQAGQSMWLVLRVNRDVQTTFAVAVNANSSGMSAAGGIGFPSSTVVTTDAVSTTTGPVSKCSPIGTGVRGERFGAGVEYVWAYLGGSTLSGVTINTITVYAVNFSAAKTTDTITGMWIVGNPPPVAIDNTTSGSGWSLTKPVGSVRALGTGLNQVIGPGSPRERLYKGTQWIINDNFTSFADIRPPAHVSMTSTFNWPGTPGATTIYPTSRWGGTVQTDVGTFTAGGVTPTSVYHIVGGVNKATSLVDGETRFSATGVNAPNPTAKFDPYLRNTLLTGFSIYNFDQFSLKLNNTRVNATYVFGDIEGNNYGIYAYSDDATCPTNVNVHYRTFGPNNALFFDSTVDACPGFRYSFTLAFDAGAVSGGSTWTLETIGQGGPVDAEFVANSFSGSTFNFAFARVGDFSLSAAGDSTFGALQRDRGYSFSTAATEETTFNLQLDRAVGLNVIEAVGAGFSGIQLARGASFSTAATTTASFTPEYSKGVAFGLSALSDVIFSYTPLNLLDIDISAASDATFAWDRNRGFDFDSDNVVTVTPSLGVDRGISYSSTAVTTVTQSLSKSKFVELALAATAVVTKAMQVSRPLRVVVAATSTLVQDLVRSRTVQFVVANTSKVTEVIGKAKDMTFEVIAYASSTIKVTRLKPVEFVVSAISSGSAKLLKNTQTAWSTAIVSDVVFNYGTLLNFMASAVSGASVDWIRDRGAKFTAAEAAQAVFGTTMNKAAVITSVSTSNVVFDNTTFTGLVFTVPMTTSTNINLTRNPGVRFSAGSSTFASIVLGKAVGTSNFKIVGQSGTSMVVDLQRPLEYLINEFVSFDGHVLVKRPLTGTFGSTSTFGQTIGIGRGVKFVVDAVLDAVVEFTRLVPLSWTSKTESNEHYHLGTTRLDAFFVAFEEPQTLTLSDGSIVLNTRLTSSGNLTDVREVHHIQLPPPQLIYLLLQEDDIA